MTTLPPHRPRRPPTSDERRAYDHMHNAITHTNVMLVDALIDIFGRGDLFQSMAERFLSAAQRSVRQAQRSENLSHIEDIHLAAKLANPDHLIQAQLIEERLKDYKERVYHIHEQPNIQAHPTRKMSATEDLTM